MNKRGIASTADAIIFLATMLLAISAMYSLSIATNAGYNEDEGAILQAKWTAQALCGATYTNGFSFHIQLVNNGYIDNLEWVNSTMEYVGVFPNGCRSNLLKNLRKYSPGCC